ncbi:tripartite motif-containing protein 3-like [Pecten maximus]|uniref:tripartite motif-containing protein 3-like n=1 Tax=Pecten maximus TaxID=6579 RepID=UPI0014581F7E|nr:tripartite motif-containing protein 3-like [Pecten maximus]
MESSDNIYVQQLKERFLECPVCLEEFSQETRLPRVLPCLHTHCDSCLKNIMKDASVKCTLCLKIYPVPDENLGVFPTDYTRKDLQDFVRASLHRHDLVCEGCSSNDTAKFRCTTCGHFLCEACKDAHGRLVVFQTHDVFSLEEERSSEENISKFAHQAYCKTQGHEREAMHYYCTGCDKSICTRCFLIHHKSHEVKDIQEVYDTKKTLLQDEAQMLHRRISECNSIRAKVTQAKEEVESNRTRSVEELNAAFETLLQLLTRRRDDLMDTINTVASRKNGILQQQDQSLDIIIKSIETCCDFLHQSLTYNNQPAFLKIAPIISRRFAYLQTLVLDEEPYETSYLSFNGLNIGLTFGTFIQSLGNIESSAFYQPNTRVHAEPATNGSLSKVIIELQNHEGNLLDEHLDIEGTVLKDSEIHSKTRLAHRDGGTYEMILPAVGPYQLSLKAFDEKMPIWEGPVSKPGGQVTHHRVGPSTASRRHRRSSDTSNLEHSSLPLRSHMKTIDDLDLESAKRPERPPLPQVELLHPDRGTNGANSLLTIHNAPPNGSSRTDRSITRATFHLDETTLHKSRFLSKDRKHLFNRKQTRLQSEDEQEDRKPMTVRSRREHKLQRYQGVKSSAQITLPDDVYFEVDITYQFDQNLTNDIAIFEIGFAHDSVVDSSDTVGNDKQSCSIAAYACSNDGTLRLGFRENGKLMSSHTVQANPACSSHVITLGLNADTQSESVNVLDKSRQPTRLYTFTNQDYRSGIWPVFGVFNPQKIDVVLNLKSGSEITYIPFHLLK